jgi:hypothetical protein
MPTNAPTMMVSDKVMKQNASLAHLGIENAGSDEAIHSGKSARLIAWICLLGYAALCGLVLSR